MRFRILGRTGLKVSCLGLGTAEIGFEYGIGHRPVPSEKDAVELLKCAAFLGINFIDTAHLHRVADQRIAKSRVAKIKGMVIATKCAHFLERGENLSLREMEQRIRTEVEESLRNLEIDTIPILQLHGPSKEQIEDGHLIEIMIKLQNEGKFQFAGVSTRGTEAPLAAINCGYFDTIQIAYSILDQRMANEVIPLAVSKGVGIINRSVFLKGALTQLAERLPVELNELKEKSRQLGQIAEELGLSLPELALRFVLSSGHTLPLIGTNKVEHLREAVQWSFNPRLDQNIVSKLEELAVSNIHLIDPKQWPQLN